MSFIDRQSAAIIREFVNKTRQLSIKELSEYLNNEEHCKIKGFSRDIHMDLIFDIIMEDRGFDFKELMKNDVNQSEQTVKKEHRVKHSITLLFTEPSLQLVSDKIVRVPFSHGKKTSDIIDRYLSKENLDERVYQSNGVVETIQGDIHLIDHIFYVFVSDMKELQSFLSLKKMKSVDRNIWLMHISKLHVLSFDKKYISQLNEKKKQIEKS